MSSPPSIFDSYTPYLNHHGSIPFIEETSRGFVYYTLCGLRCQCLWVMAASVMYLCIGIIEGIKGFLDGAEPDVTMMLVVGGLVIGLVGYLFYRLFGWMLRARRGPPDRLIDLSYYGLRISTRYGVQPIHGPTPDDQGRMLLPWTDWLDILDCRPVSGGLAVEVRGLPELIVLALPWAQAENAAELAVTLHRLARRRSMTA